MKERAAKQDYEGELISAAQELELRARDIQQRNDLSKSTLQRAEHESAALRERVAIMEVRALPSSSYLINSSKKKKKKQKRESTIRRHSRSFYDDPLPLTPSSAYHHETRNDYSSRRYDSPAASRRMQRVL